jgi:hypothetical protein
MLAYPEKAQRPVDLSLLQFAVDNQLSLENKPLDPISL